MMTSSNVGETRCRRAAWRGIFNVGAALSLLMTLVLIPGCPPPMMSECSTDADCADMEGEPVCLVDEETMIGTCVECADNADCDNGMFCDGAETCSDMNACEAGTDPCMEGQTCDEDADVCRDVCSSDADCSGDTPVCDTDSGVCVECLEDADCDNGLFCDGAETCGDDNACAAGTNPCDADQTCNEDTDMCEDMAPEGFSVMIEGCPESAAGGTDVMLNAATSNAMGTVEFEWSASAGTFDDNTLQAPTLTLPSQGLGNITVTVTATDDTGDTATTSSDTDSCTISSDVTQLTVNAGADRTLIPNNNDFTGNAFAAGSQLASGAGAGVVPNLAAVVNRGNDSNISVLWETVSVPAGANVADVTILNSGSLNTGYLVIPDLNNSATLLQSTGADTTATNTVIPGSYTFRVTVADLDNPELDAASDEVTQTIVPAFAIPAAAAGSNHGVANAPNNLTNYTIAPNSIDLGIKLLSLVNGTLTYSLRDAFDNTQAAAPLDFNQSGAIDGTDLAMLYNDFTAVQTLNETMVMAQDDTIVDDTATVSSSERGTYILQAALSSSAASVAAAPAGGLAAFHVQTALPSALDTRAMTANSTLNHFGLVNSTDLVTGGTALKTVLHGARSSNTQENLWDATAVTCCDLNGDGWDEVILGLRVDTDDNDGFNDLGVAILRGLNEDPTVATNSPLDNSTNNFGNLIAGADGGDGDGNPDPNGTTIVDVFEITGGNNVNANRQISAIGCCDLDNDGNRDLVIGDPFFGANAQAGRVLIYYGTANSGFGQNPWTTNGNTVAGGATLVTPVVLSRTDADGQDHDLFGYRLECCDYNNDDIDDLVVTAPGGGQTVANAQVATNVAADAGVNNNNVISVDDSAGGNADLSSLAVGDLIEFGTENLFRRVTVVDDANDMITVDRNVTIADNSVVNEKTGVTGAVYGFLGSIVRRTTTTVNDAGAGADARWIPQSAQSGDFTGAALCCEDVTGDGVADITAGAPGRFDSAGTPNSSAGAVLVLNGSSFTSTSVTTITRIYEGNTAFLGFGRTLSCADFNGDNANDFVVGALVGDTTNGLDAAAGGRVYFISNTVGGIQSSQIGNPGAALLSAQPRISGGANDSNLGTNICCFDFNGDGSDDTLALAPSATAANAQVVLINGSDSLSTSVSASTTMSDGSPATFLRQPGLTTVLETGLDPNGVLYDVNDACGFCDLNGDQIRDLYFSGDRANGSSAYAIMGSQ